MSHPHELSESDARLMDPIPVTIVHNGSEQTEKHAPDSSEWQTWRLNGNEQPFRLLPYNPKRDRAVIIVGAGAAGNTNGYVMVGSQNKVTNGQGGILRSGAQPTVEGASEVWCVPDGANSLWVTVLDERYQ